MYGVFWRDKAPAAAIATDSFCCSHLFVITFGRLMRDVPTGVIAVLFWFGSRSCIFQNVPREKRTIASTRESHQVVAVLPTALRRCGISVVQLDKEKIDAKTSAAKRKPQEAPPSSTLSKDHGDGATSGGTEKPSLTTAPAKLSLTSAPAEPSPTSAPDGDGAASGDSAKPPFTSPAGGGVASAEKEPDAADKLLEPEGWSEWRALSSDDESDKEASAGVDVGDGDGDGGPTTRNVRGTGQGFQISVRRGSSLERRSGDTDVGRRGAHRERSASPRDRFFVRSSRSRDRGSRYDRGDTSRRSSTRERYRERGGYADYAGRANRSRSRERGGGSRPTARSDERASEPSGYAALADGSQASKRARVDATATTRAAAAGTAALSSPKKQGSMVLPAAGKVPSSTTGASLK